MAFTQALPHTLPPGTMASVADAPVAQLSVEATRAADAGAHPRKRRRRTAGGGASDDCFACQKRNARCDRKRPYCTQCIENGKECSGYKTALTWDVGVASRGKLRGLACPVANKNVDGSDASPAEMEKRRRMSSSSKVKKEQSQSQSQSQLEHDSKPAITHFLAPQEIARPSAAHTNALSQGFLPNTQPATSTSLPNGWQPSSFQDRLQARTANSTRHMSMDQPQLQHLYTSLGPQYDSINMPQSSRSYSSYSDAEFQSPLEYAHTPVSLPFVEPLSQSLATDFEDPSIVASVLQSLSLPQPSMPPYNGAVDSTLQNTDLESIAGNESSTNANQYELDPFNNDMFNRLATYVGPGIENPLFHNDELKHEQYDMNRTGLVLFDARFASPFFSMSPRMRSLMEYYSRNVCPHLVAFDGPDNPYRKHILQLAVDNEGLQNAIAALSSNNFRMRNKQPRQIGFVDEISNTFDVNSSKGWNEPSPEEICFKQMAISQLNLQLYKQEAAQDDSVLAMLLILCLFHVCDSGFSQFQNQLAGVQLLLSYRRPDTHSEFTKWVKMFFVWFDVMTSTVNDREVQMESDSLSMLDFSANLGALEQYSGCDGRLFKLIARLGRLNVLAQGKPVKGQPTPKRGPASMKSMNPFKKPKTTMTFYGTRSLHAADYDNIDGNGWGTPIISSDEDADGSADEVNTTDSRQEFWREWQDVRTRLCSWQMDTPNMTPSDLNTPTDLAELDARQRDMIHINESFRYSALLYTERLGFPLLPSSHDQFQQLVAQVLYHITSLPVTSCVNKFLMWPLFIAGTECVAETHRDFVRRRCRDLTEESGFFNNISSLWILERVWRDAGSNVRGSEADEVRARRRDSETSKSGRYGQAFRWRKAMDRVEDGEYIVL